MDVEIESVGLNLLITPKPVTHEKKRELKEELEDLANFTMEF